MTVASALGPDMGLLKINFGSAAPADRLLANAGARKPEAKAETKTDVPRKSLTAKYKAAATARLLHVVSADDFPALPNAPVERARAEEDSAHDRALRAFSERLDRLEEAACAHIDEWLDDASVRLRKDLTASMLCELARERAVAAARPSPEAGRLDRTVGALEVEVEAQKAQVEALRAELQVKPASRTSLEASDAALRDLRREVNQQRDHLEAVFRQLDAELPRMNDLQNSVADVRTDVAELQAGQAHAEVALATAENLVGRCDKIEEKMTQGSQMPRPSDVNSATLRVPRKGDFGVNQDKGASLQDSRADIDRLTLEVADLTRGIEVERKARRSALGEAVARMDGLASGLEQERSDRAAALGDVQERLNGMRARAAELSGALDAERQERVAALAGALARLDRLTTDVAQAAAAAVERAQQTFAGGPGSPASARR